MSRSTIALAFVIIVSCNEPIAPEWRVDRGAAASLEFAGAAVRVDAYFQGELLPAEPVSYAQPGKLEKIVRGRGCEVHVSSTTVSVWRPCGHEVPVLPGTYTLQVYWAGGTPFAERLIELSSGQLMELSYDLDAVASRVRGRLLVNGSAAAGRDLCVRTPEKNSTCTTAGDDGSFDIMSAAGSATISAAFQAHAFEAPAGTTVELGDVSFSLARFELGATFAGQPVAAELLTNCGGVFSTGGFGTFVYCNRPFEYTASLTGTLNLSWQGQSLGTEDLTVPRGETVIRTIDLTERAGIISTRLLVGETVVPEAGACARFVSEGQTPHMDCAIVRPDGSISFLVPAGPVDLVLTTGARAIEVSAVAVAGQTTEVPPIQLSGGGIRTVLRYEGALVEQPVSCRVSIDDGGGSTAVPCQNGLLMAAPGTYAVSALVFGLSLPPRDVEFVTGEIKSFEVEASHVAGRITGRATFNGQPVPSEAPICAQLEGAVKMLTPPCDWPDETGRFSIVLPPGTYYLAVGDLRTTDTYDVVAGLTLEVGEPDLPEYTPPGAEVEVTPTDQTTQEPSPVTLTFDDVTGAGTTTVASSSTGAPPPQGFKLGNPPTYYEIQTTAEYSGPITVCIDYSEASFGNERQLRLLHDDGSGWQDVTLEGYPDTENNLICGEVSSLSPFVLAEANVAPVVTSISLPTAPVAIGSGVGLEARFTDANPTDVHTALIDWEASEAAGAAVQSGGVGSVTAQHTYAEAGVYTVSVTVSDGHLSATRSSALDIPAYVVVYDPSEGHVTGGGWITSPEGAYVADPQAAGKATFGFVARYKPGASTPSGNTEFHFSAADFRFRSTSYEWLVPAGDRAQFKGRGEVNGAGEFGFLLTAIDGGVSSGSDPDRFRIKIWHLATSEVIYDNQAGAAEDSDAATALGGGSIVIHRR